MLKLNTLLDLKQKASNAWEARSARECALEAAKQGNVRAQHIHSYVACREFFEALLTFVDPDGLYHCYHHLRMLPRLPPHVSQAEPGIASSVLHGVFLRSQHHRIPTG